MYVNALGFVEIGSFEDHEGFDGVMLGLPGENWHLEYTFCKGHPVQPTPTAEDILIFYIPVESEWRQLCDAMRLAGFSECEPLNPYWSKNGCMFMDNDGYQVVIQCQAWGENPSHGN